MYNEEVETEDLNQPRSNKMIDQLVIIENDRPMTNSRIVAERFGKEHKNVMQAISGINKDLAAEIPAANLAISEESIESKVKKIAAFFNENFIPDEYLDSRGKKQPMFRMTEEGFLMLAMGFTGLDAAAFRIDFLNAFKQLANKVKQLEAENFRLLQTEYTNMRRRLHEFNSDDYACWAENELQAKRDEIATLTCDKRNLEEELAVAQAKPKLITAAQLVENNKAAQMIEDDENSIGYVRSQLFLATEDVKLYKEEFAKVTAQLDKVYEINAEVKKKLMNSFNTEKLGRMLIVKAGAL